MQPSPEHQRAIQLRESGQSQEALTTYQRVFAEYEAAQNWEGMVRTLLEQVITYKHQLEETSQPDQNILDQAQQAVTYAQRLVQEHQLGAELEALVALTQGGLALVHEQPHVALEAYGRAVSLTPPENPSYGYRLIQLGHAQWLLGDQRSATTLEQGIAGIEAARSQLDDHTYRVWLSGT